MDYITAAEQRAAAFEREAMAWRAYNAAPFTGTASEFMDIGVQAKRLRAANEAAYPEEPEP